MRLTFTIIVDLDANIPSPEACAEIARALEDTTATELIQLDGVDFAIEADWRL